MVRRALISLVAVAAMLAATIPVHAASIERTELHVLVIDDGGRPLANASVVVGSDLYVTGADGRVHVGAAGPGAEVHVSRAGWTPRTVTWPGGGERFVIPISRPVSRGIHLTGYTVHGSRWGEMLDIAERTSVNTLVVDVKDESGYVFPTTNVATARQVGAALDRFDLAAVTADAHARGLRVVVRIVSFQDPLAGRARPDMSAWNTATSSPLSRRGQVFLDPTDPNARQYALDLATEACAAGVDEVQFDYVRFPDGSKVGVFFDGGSSPDVRQRTITDFLAEARSLLAPEGCATAADIFGFITSISGEGGIGQQLEALAGVTDVLSPMAYPSHYSSGWYGFSNPNAHPGPVIHHSQSEALARVATTGVEIRPWLQDFYYVGSQVRAQIKAADDLGLGWMLWNASSVFQVSGIPRDDELRSAPEAGPAYVAERPDSGFWDVPDENMFGPAIAWLADAGITRGCNHWADDFCPGRALTRAEGAAMVARAVGLLPSSGSTFVDLDGRLLGPEIEALAEAGVTYGCAADRFCPDDVLSRGELAALLVRALQLEPATGPSSFTDLDGAYFADEIEALAAAGISNGCRVGEFCPNDAVTREEMAAMLHRSPLAG